ncbi:MAG: hypothetical protein K6D94_12650, partial [Clostridiales bacterium]|nr:hypothetical protein [Clostridiales bacterium]
MKTIRIGAVNWDASLTKDTYFGYYQIRSLSQAKYRTWVPFYADIIDGERVDYHRRTVDEYEIEIRCAVEAGIDYFAYVWYPTEGSLCHEQTSPNDCSHKVHELNHARRLYEQSSLTDRIGMCAILAAHPFTDRDLSELADTFSKPYYEKIDGRPLLYVFGGYRADVIARVHAVCRERGIPVPYTVPMLFGVSGCGEPMPLADAVSAYAVSNSKDIDKYEQLCRVAAENDMVRMSSDKDIIPLFSVGWNPSPRIERPTPWTTNSKGETIYAKARYAPRPNENELLDGAGFFSDHI